ncbi:hypothetical protein HOK96_01225 [bacterium]|jgi:hypothetical protein|nr:hypothetical protein [bacterium]MBT3903612.1 hypothetical protein [bacterium]MBT4578179.1 hypothetical protein [bacterium]MBT5345656.1 hypothetical protein [bacterium]MBT6130657.1 hypothetical protein [bacterium]
MKKIKIKTQLGTRPALTSALTGVQFLDEYWLQSEQKEFCRDNGLSSWGNKAVVADRIVTFLDMGEILTPKKPKIKGLVDSDNRIQNSTLVVNYKSDSKTREYFKKRIGSHFKFTVSMHDHRKKQLQNGVKLTYDNMAIEWESEYERRKNPGYQTKISASCEFNQFARDYADKKKKGGLENIKVSMMQMWKMAKQCKGPTTLKNLLDTKAWT